MSCGVGRRNSSDPTLLWLWWRPATRAPIWLLAWEPPYAKSTALKKTKSQKTKICRRQPKIFLVQHFHIQMKEQLQQLTYSELNNPLRPLRNRTPVSRALIQCSFLSALLFLGHLTLLHLAFSSCFCVTLIKDKPKWDGFISSLPAARMWHSKQAACELPPAL